MNNISLMLWGSAVVLYLVFLAWHENWRGPLREAEIQQYAALLDANAELADDQRQVLIEFMRSDTGREFFMVNFLAFPDGMVRHPDTEADITARVLLQDYFRPFAGMIIRRAGYPAYTGRVKGDYIEYWGVAPNPGWQEVGLIRYRSRRDILRAATHPDFLACMFTSAWHWR